MSKKILSILMAALIFLSLASVSIPANAASTSSVQIVTQPEDVTVACGETAKATVAAEGEGLSYQWYYKDVKMTSFKKSSVKTNTYTLKMIPSKNERQIYCKITDKNGNTVDSDIITLRGTVSIAKQPKSVVVDKGATAKVTLSAQGSGLTYEWYYKDAGASSFSKTSSFKGNYYTVQMNSKRDGRQIYCKITDKYGNTVTSDTVTIGMGNTAKITTQPQSASVAKGETVTVSLSATGDELTYAWYYKDATSSSFKKTNSFKGDTYTVEMTAARSGRQLYCIVKDKYGNSVKSDIVTISLADSVKITTQPKNAVVSKNDTAKVTVTAEGSGLTYQWYYKDTNMSSFQKSSVKTNTYTLKMVSSKNGRQVYCKITDEYGCSVSSDIVTLSIGNAAKITTQPKNVVVANGAKAKVTVKATGDGLSYRWYYKDSGKSSFSKSSVTVNSYTPVMSTSKAGRQVYCVITDKYGNTVQSNTVTIQITATIVTQPQSVVAGKGETAKVTVKAVGVDLTYQWYYKDAGKSAFSKSSVTSDTYTLTMQASKDERQVYCVVTDAYGNTARSDTVVLSMTHTYDNGTVIKEPTCSEEGQMLYTCTVCSKEKIEPIPTGGHNLGDWEVYREATAENEGVERRTCKDCTYYQDRSTDKVAAAYTITVNVGDGTSYKVKVGKNGLYTLQTPSRTGYTFTGWTDSSGKAFSASGTVKKNVTVKGNWELKGTSTQTELIARTEAGASEILITGNITITQPIYISHSTKIYCDEDFTITRDPKYTGDLFVVGQDKTGRAAVRDYRDVVLTLGGGKGTLTIDGNRDNMTVTVVGSALYVSDSATVNLYDGVRIVNNLKLGNERVLKTSEFASNSTVMRAGGSAILILRGTVNMYGGVIENNAVSTEYTVVTNDDGTESKQPYHACGGAVFNQGNFNMYGGTITGSEALRGGGIYSHGITYLVAGTVSNNKAYSYGGGLSTSSSADADIHIGSESGSSKMVFSGNECVGVGGALYSNTNSPILVYGNTEFLNNTSTTSGGAIHTAGPLTIRNAAFSGNACPGSGGAIYHHYTKAEATRRLMTLENCVFENNSANLGGAVILSATGDVTEAGTYATITDCTFNGNHAVMKETSTGSGGALYITKYSQATITGCDFTANTSTGNAGALAVQTNCNVKLSDSTFTGNNALNGGALYTTGATVKLSDLTFTENTAAANESGGAGLGGAAYIYKTDVTASNLDVHKNSAGNHGGGIYLGATDLTLDAESEFVGNSAAKHGGAFYLTYYSNSDGTKTGSVLKATGVSFSENTAMAGGAISARTACTVELKDAVLANNSVTGYADKNDGDGDGGGAIYVGFGTAKLTNVTATGNSASDFGGVVNSLSSDVTITGGSFTENSSNSGGVVYAKSSTVIVSGATMSNNVSVTENTEYNTSVGGGAINTSGGTLDIKNTTMDGNSTGYYGGAVLTSGTTVTIGENSKFSGSTGSTGAALYFKGGSKVTITDTSITANTARGNGVLYQNGGTLTMDKVTASGNNANNGGVLYVSGGSTTVTLTNSTWSENSASNGGAMYIANATVQLSGSEVSGNTACTGGAAYVKVGTLELTDATFSGNSAKRNANNGGSGGAINMTGGSVTVSGDSKFVGNTSENHGGAVHVSYFTNEDETRENGALSVVNGTFENNTAMGGGAVSIRTDCSATFDGTTFTGNSANVESENADGYGEGGGAVYVGYGALNLSNVTFTGNSALAPGGAVQVLDSTAEISNATFTQNTAGGNGGAVNVQIDAASATTPELDADTNTYTLYDVTLANLTFTENTGKNGGAVYVSDNGIVKMTDLAFTGNKATSNGGAAYIYTPYITLSNLDSNNNSAASNGGALYLTGLELTVDSQWEFTGNQAGGHGGAIYLVYRTDADKNKIGSVLHASGVTFDGNSAMAGGVISARTNCEVYLEDVTLTNNSVTGYADENDGDGDGGGVIYAGFGKVSLKNVTATNNTAESFGGVVDAYNSSVTIEGGTFTGNASVNGGVISALDSSEVTITGGTYSGNKATSGGAIHAEHTVTITDATFDANESTYKNSEYDTSIGGGAIHMAGGSLTISNTKLTNNKSGNYGGTIHASGTTVQIDKESVVSGSTGSTGAALYFRGGSTVTLENITVTKNTSSSNGIIYQNGGTLTISKVSATENVGTSGGVFFVSGGSTNVNITDCTWSGNSASTGGVGYISNASVTVSNCTFTENSSKLGGAFYNRTGNLNLSGTTFTGNTATTNGGAIAIAGGTVVADGTNTFTNNSAASGHAGAIYVAYFTPEGATEKTPGVLRMGADVLENNSAMAGGAISARTACEIYLDGTTLTGNSVTGYADENDGNGEGGGAIYVGFGTANLTNVIATGNTASDFGGFLDAVDSTVNITGGTFTKNTANAGGVINSIKGSIITVTNATMSENESLYVQGETYNSDMGGGAIQMAEGTLTVNGTVLTANKTGYYGGAILANKATITIGAETVISDTTGSTGAALYFKGGCTVTITNSSIMNNTSTSNGVIYQNSGTLDMTGVTATGNQAYSGGVLYASGSANVTVHNSTWSGNTATNGGAIYVVGATVTLADGTKMTENSATSGGAAYANNGATLNLTGAAFDANSASGDGGAIYIKAATVTGADTENVVNTFTGNTAANHGGAVYVNYIKGEDGQANTPGILTLTGGLFENNEAFAGGAISSRTSCQVTLTGTQLKSNAATSPQSEGYGGGSIYSNDGTLTLSGVTMDGNTSAYYGGAVYTINTDVTIDGNSLIQNNTAVTGVALYFKGSASYTLDTITVQNNILAGGTSNGVIYLTGNGTMDVTRLTATGNKSTNGGVFFISGNRAVTVTDSTLTNNTANKLGGVVNFTGSGSMTITGSTLEGNTAENGGAINVTNGTVNVNSSTVKSNTAVTLGGAVNATNGTVNINGSTLESNTAGERGGAIFSTATAVVNVSENSTLTGNSAPTGGAVCVDAGGNVTISDSALTGNSATSTDGGAILIADSSEEGTMATTLTMTNTSLEGNTAEQQGGALATDTASPNLVINATGCTFSGNTATTKGGGAVEIKNGNCNSATDPTVVTLVFKDCTFTGNKSVKSTGGAVEIRTNSCAKFDGITATNNSAKANGGAIYVTSLYSRVYLTGDVTQSGNTSTGGTFIHLYHDGKYTNPPKLYTTHSSDAAWVSNVGGDKGNGTNIAFDLETLP